MLIPSGALAIRMICWAVVMRRSHPFIYLSALHCAVTSRRRASTFLSCVAASLRTPVRPKWSCVLEVGGIVSASR